MGAGSSPTSNSPMVADCSFALRQTGSCRTHALLYLGGVPYSCYFFLVLVEAQNQMSHHHAFLQLKKTLTHISTE